MTDLKEHFEQPSLPEEPPPDLDDEAPPPDLLEQLEDNGGQFDDFQEALASVGGVWDCTHVDLLDMAITIHSFVEVTTKYGEALVAKVEDAHGVQYALLGGEVLVDQLKKVERFLPLETVIVKKEGKRYYEFGSTK